MHTPKDLKNNLKQMGLTNIFNPQLAEIPMLITHNSQQLCINDVYHKATLEIDEHGLEAAGATALLVLIRMWPHPMKSIVIDRPFMFAIRHERTGVILFLGKVVRPNC